jgi:RHS repeat-associated protein
MFRSESADGTATTTRTSAHPVLGPIASYPEWSSIVLPSGKALTSSTTITATQASPDLFGWTSWEQVSEIGPARVTTTWNGASRELRVETGEGRVWTSMLDELGRAIESTGPGAATTAIAYDGNGRVTDARQATRTTTISYDGLGYPSSVTAPDNSTTGFARDTMGRVVTGTRADNEDIDFTWDGMGRMAGITPPASAPYDHGWTKRGQMSRLDGPASTLQLDYDSDYRVTRITTDDGRSVDVAYDASGRLSTANEGGEETRFIYDDGVPGQLDGTGQLSVLQDTDVDLGFTYDGFLPTEVAMTGAISGSVSWLYGEHLRLDAIGVNGTEVAYTYDTDGVITQAGNQQLSYNSGTFQLAQRSQDRVQTSFEYDEYGAVSRIAATAVNSPLLDLVYTRDELGRVTQIVETDQGVERTFDFSYDAIGQLVGVTVDGAPTETYVYDPNGNRLGGPGGAVGTYGAEDELLSYDGRTYTYRGGQLRTMTDGAVTTTYDYGVGGELNSVDDGTTRIEYLHDGLGRRVGKRINGALVTGWLYQDGLNPIAELEPNGDVRSRFVYASRGHVPDTMLRDGREYALVTDMLGSVRYVVDTATGAVEQRLEYDAFGRVLSDSNPGFQPFGFAGGLTDQDTGLVRFGARDYDPHAGRWTAVDPIRFAGRQTNLWVYASNLPTSAFDPTGLFEAAGGFGVRVAFSLFDFGFSWGANVELTSNEGLGIYEVGATEVLGAGAGVSFEGNLAAGPDGARWGGESHAINASGPLVSGSLFASTGDGPRFRGISVGVNTGTPGLSYDRSTYTRKAYSFDLFREYSLDEQETHRLDLDARTCRGQSP